MSTAPAYPSPRVASSHKPIRDLMRRLQRGPAPTLLVIAAGLCMGGVTALALFATKPLVVALPIAGLLLVIPTFVVRDKRLYWLGVLLFALQFEIEKNLNDGLAVINELNIDYTLWHFTFQVHATDLVLTVLLFYWYLETVFKRQRPYFPRIAWLVVGFLGFCLLSLRCGTLAIPGAGGNFAPAEIFPCLSVRRQQRQQQAGFTPRDNHGGYDSHHSGSRDGREVRDRLAAAAGVRRCATGRRSTSSNT